TCYAGEVHALLGENGAGKSTLMKIVAGVLAPDAGEMRLDGAPYRPASPKRAMGRGVGMVHQDFQLVPRFSVAENLFLGWEGASRVAGLRSLAARSEAAIGHYGFELRPLARVEELSVGEQQRVAILRALVRGVSVLILDEPTAALTPQEADSLFVVMRRLADEGCAVLFVTHKLREILAVSTKVTVLRSGRRIVTLSTSECDERRLAREMLGRDLELPSKTAARPRLQRDSVLRAVEVSARDDRGIVVVHEVSLEVRSGEIVGIAGVAGNGQRELSEAVTGMRKLESGRVFVGDEDMTGKSAAAFVKVGVGHIPEDRMTSGVILRYSIADNSILRALNIESDRAYLTRSPWLRRKRIESYARDLLVEGRVSTANPKVKAGNLSGGNIQRFLIARELRAAKNALVAVHPTRGLDVGASSRVWRTLMRARDEGIGVLLISEDLDEVLSLSDRILVFSSGRIAGEVDNTAATPSREDLGLLMGGATLFAASRDEAASAGA
ncbi:MAG: ABC transporter ATP-binding protein, partial [Acidimicrobiales bacterium]